MGRAVTESDESERLRMDLMQAQIDNLKSDSALKEEQRRWEPVKAMSAAFGAGLAVATALLGLAVWVLSHLGHT
jgi:hypothetical protein